MMIKVVAAVRNKPLLKILSSHVPSFFIIFPISQKSNPRSKQISIPQSKKMKRDHHQFHQLSNHNTTISGSSSSSLPVSAAKDKMMMVKEEEEEGGNMDELLAVLGYKVKSSEMADVALKLEQLETMMSNVQEDGLSNLGTDTVHYNPSELYSWLNNMLTELNPPASTGLDPILPSSEIDSSFFSGGSSNGGFADYSISGNEIFQTPNSQFVIDSSNQIGDNQNKRLKSCSSPDLMVTSTSTAPQIGGITGTAAESTRSVILVDSQENGVRLVHALMACAEAIQNNNLTLAEALVKQIGFLAVSQAGAMRKVATYFAEALARRIYRLSPPLNQIDHSLSDTLQMHFYETCPYLKFAHFTANQAILEAFEGKKRVHVIDFSMNQGLQWPALMQALAVREGGPPVFRLTGIGPPSPDNSDPLREVGCKLAQLAEAINVEFEYRGFVANSLTDLDPSMLELRSRTGLDHISSKHLNGVSNNEVEAVAVNSVFDLHKLLAHPGGLEKVLDIVNQIKPVVFTVVEQESNHNGPVFLDRFTESLHYYSTLFDSLEGVPNSQDKAMSEIYLGKQICNLVACEGPDRVERHETLSQWRNRFELSGFSPVHIGSNAFKQASMILALFNSGEGYRVEENNGCLMLNWHTRPLITTSAWKPTVAH